ncbi:ATP-binding protein [Telluria mixta]|uniref:histidine kinase n=1 Tax=Telluria mixta TaxID=34071 RepID=A0ABT2C4W4_9BURK|nr:ATP-binding protein [Telluria mixta]MCS0632437.1 ATP-binding protein [Telluria mixta]WEM94813.1 ATP-binding protein [Telluria mixta]
MQSSESKTGTVLAVLRADAGDEAAVAAAARLAARGDAPWHAVLVENAHTRRRGEAARLRTLELLRQAHAQGAVTAVLEGRDAPAVVAGYARRHGCTTAVLAREHRFSWWHGPFGRRLTRAAPELDLVDVAAPSGPIVAGPRVSGNARPRPYLAAVGASLATAIVALPLLPLLDVANVAMLFLLTVVLVAIRLGRGPAILATLVGFCALVAAAPRREYDVSEFKYAVALVVMLAVGWITARLTSDLREQAESAIGREARTRALYEFARALSVALQTEQVFEITRRFLARTFDARAVILLPDDAGRLRWPAAEPGSAERVPVLSVLDMAAAQWAFDHAAPAGAETPTLPSNPWLYLPLLAPMRSRGVLAVRVPDVAALLVPERRELLDAFAALAAIALERVHYVDVAQDAVVRMEGERLRNSLLAALSHDLRTPLTSLVGLSESLTLSRPPLAAAQMELANALRDEARRMSTLVANLLDMARIQSGGVTLNLQWQMVEETIGSALRACRWQLGGRSIDTRIPRGLPLVRFDATLLERVLCNLLENAGKYTPPDAHVTIAARTEEGMLTVAVCDDGPGLPAGREDALFEKFVRGRQESSIAGVGLGLAICRAIVEAHGGGMRAFNRPDAGACFELSLPLGEPPPLPLPEAHPDPEHQHHPIDQHEH